MPDPTNPICEIKVTRVIKTWQRILTIVTLHIFVLVHSNPVWAAPSYAANSCVQSQADSCIDSTPCKSIGGVTVCLAGIAAPPGATSVTETCWNYSAEFKCQDTSFIDTCAALVTKGCNQVGSTCQNDAAGTPMTTNGTCTTFTQTYQCETTPSTSSQVLDCSASTVCGADGSCWSTPSQPDGDFAAASASMELVRQASVYMGADAKMFAGDAESCTEGYGGLRKCCDAKASGTSNSATMKSQAQTLALKAAWSAAKPYAVQGSAYVQDFMFSAGMWAQDGANAMLGTSSSVVTNYVMDSTMEKIAAENAATQAGGGVAAIGSGGIGAYGVTYGASGAAGVAAGEAIGAGAGTLGGPLYSLGNGFAFDPVSLGISIAIMVVMAMIACTPAEAQLQMHKGSHLCTPVGSYCSTKILGACTVTTQAYCCYNSILAKIINEQGRPQIGKGYGNPKSPECSGFTIPEIQKLDFSQINMAEFSNTIIENLPNMPDIPALTTTVSARQTGKTVNPPPGSGH